MLANSAEYKTIFLDFNTYLFQKLRRYSRFSGLEGKD